MNKIKYYIKYDIALCFLVLFGMTYSQESLAQKKSKTIIYESERPSLTWDLGAGTGSYNNSPYSEVNLGLNWYLSDYLNWRNVLFSRSGVSYLAASGLDSSLRLEFGEKSEDGALGIRFFAGGGARFSSAQNSGYFGEGGLTLKVGGLNIGVGMKALTYASPGKDPATGSILPNTDVSYFIMMSGAGAL